MKIRFVAIATASVAAAAAGLVGGLVSAHADTTAPPTETSMSQVGHPAGTGSAGRVINVSDFGDSAFVSPSGRIAYHLTDFDDPNSASVECEFPDGPVNTTLPSSNRTCHGAGNLDGVSEQSGGRPTWICATDAYVQPLLERGNTSVAWAHTYAMPTTSWIHEGRSLGRAAELPYGSTIVAGNVACTMHTTGVVCESLTNHKGFMLNSHQVTPIGAHAFTS